MIINDTQYKVTSAAAAQLRAALQDRREADTGDLHPALVAAHWAGVADELASLERQLREYDDLKSGKIPVVASSLEELPDALIRARIARGWTQRVLAEHLELQPQQIQRYEAERYRSAGFGRILAIARVLDVAVVQETRSGELLEDIPPSLFPVAEMSRRGWFEDFEGTPIQAKKQAPELVPAFFRHAGMYEHQLAYHRRSERKGSEVDEASLLAWEARVRILAGQKEPRVSFSPDKLSDDWLRSLVALSVREEGPARAIDELLRIGIVTVIEAVLQGTRLDGAALTLPSGTPVVALTLRYDRLDNFWFTLLHELAHVKLHIRDISTAAILDDLEDVPLSAIETEADLFAQEALIPSLQWRQCLSRFSRTEKAIQRDAELLGISPAIIAGRIRRDAGNYMLFKDLVGQGGVRKHFQERFE